MEQKIDYIAYLKELSYFYEKAWENHRYIPKKQLKSIESRGDDTGESVLQNCNHNLFELAQTTASNGFVENECLSKEDSLELKMIRIIKAIYLTLHEYGLNEISIKDKDLEKYVLKIAKLLDEYDVKDKFKKRPKYEIYDKYKEYLLNIFYEQKLGYFKDESIILNCEKYTIKNMEDYQDIIDEGCHIIDNELELGLLKKNKIKIK